MGARHITFGDPDFLNGRRHSLAIVRALHERFPALTFDCTTKVEHVLEHADVWEEVAACGGLFVVSALESVNDDILARLDKGHTTEQAVRAIELLREHGIETRPSFMPFTPWSAPADVLAILDFVVANDLVANVDAVQYTILFWCRGFSAPRAGGPAQHLGPYDAERLSYPWLSADPASDRLHARLSALVEQSLAAQETIGPFSHASGPPCVRRPARCPMAIAGARRFRSARPSGARGSPSPGFALPSQPTPVRTAPELRSPFRRGTTQGMRWLQRDDLVRRIASQRRVQIGEAASSRRRRCPSAQPNRCRPPPDSAQARTGRTTSAASPVWPPHDPNARRRVTLAQQRMCCRKKNIPTTWTPWLPASSWGRIILPSL